MKAWLFDDRADACERLAALRGLRQPEQADVAGSRLRQTEQSADHRRLPGPVRAEEAERDTGRHEQVDAVDGGAVAEALRQRASLDDRFHAGTLRVRWLGCVGGLARLRDDDGHVRWREQVPDPFCPAPVSHLERSAEPVYRYEAELSRRLGVSATGDQHRSETVRRRVACAPLHERLQRVAGTTRAIVLQRCGIVERRRFCVAHRGDVACRPGVEEERAIRQLRRPRKAPLEGVDENRGSPGTSGGRLRHNRSARPSPRYAALTGLGRSRGMKAVVDGIPITRASTGSSSSIPLKTVPRKSASACATEGVPPNTAEAVCSRGSRSSARWRIRPGAIWKILRAREPSRRSTAASSCGYPANGPETRGGLRTSDTPVRCTRSARRRSISTASRQPCEALVSSSDSAPPARSDSRPLAERSAAGPPFSTVSAAVDGHDEVGLHQRPVDAKHDVAGNTDVDEILRLGVVHEHATLEPPTEVGWHEQPDLAWARAAEEPARDEDRHPLHAEALELVADRRDQLVPRPEMRGGDRQRRLLDHDRRGAACTCELLQRSAGEWVGERLPHGRSDVLDVVARPRRAQHDVVRPGLGDDHTRVRQQRDSRHTFARITLRDVPPRPRRRER